MHYFINFIILKSISLPTKKEIIQAFQNLDYNSLTGLLSQKVNCMNLPVHLFLNQIQETLNQHYSEVKTFDTIAEGICSCDCCYNKKAYRLVSQNNYALDLYLEEVENKVKSIQLCHGFKPNDSKYDDLETIYIQFYIDDRLDFMPSEDYLPKKHQVKKALEDFKTLKLNDDSTIGVIKAWSLRHNSIYQQFRSELPFENGLYRAFDEFEKIVKDVEQKLNSRKVSI